MNITASKFSFLSKGSPEWTRAWGVLRDAGHVWHEGEGWQYMGTVDGVHEFRNRDVPGGGRMYFNVDAVSHVPSA